MLGVMKHGYTLKLKNFEGPLDLLTEMLGQSKLDITEISLSEITDQYLHYIRTMQLFNIDLASEFFEMAAHLVYIKTRKLLPHLEPDEEEEIDENELLARLKEYKKFHYLARELAKIKEQGDIYYSRGRTRNARGIDKFKLDELMIGDLIAVLRRYRGAFIKKAIPIKRREVNVEAKMKFIMHLLKKKRMIKFSEAILVENTKIDKVASFMGTMELSHKQKVLLHQLKLFADIEIEKREDIPVV